MTTTPGLIEAARELSAQEYSDSAIDHKARLRVINQIVDAVGTLPPDAVVVSAALLKRAADYIESFPLEGTIDLAEKLRAAAEGATG